MSSICRYIQLGVYIRGYTDKATHSFKREIAEVTEFYVTNDTNEAGHNVIYRKGADGKVIRNNPSPYLIDYLEVQGVFLPKELQNMAGEPYTDAESMKASAQANSMAQISEKSDFVNTENTINSVNNQTNTTNFTGVSNNGFVQSVYNSVPVSEDKTVENLFE